MMIMMITYKGKLDELIYEITKSTLDIFVLATPPFFVYRMVYLSLTLRIFRTFL